MVGKLSWLKDRTLSLLPSETGAVAFEYTLVMGGVSAAIMVAFLVDQPTLMISVIRGACSSIDNLLAMDCTPWQG